ncbi:asparagine synthase (glutamine-hydrolyzing) [Pseudoxanthomonas sp. PXM04]|uniref:asparagine synthase (glutamine-hydrolyzing) n=1 Tax=Pseudoxanthomonas sp. PXM04 TaxID=2769297 RepID=UPI0017817E0D|nr:asparagine synthase (glutamine-hydrolyzing) [Pseudoxanthomonas sp. PXM04]MBD9376419.1 asparagine synthase (glutamine-hydrolyzing) [Pseudoxanthomonas sp. PXM04]UBB26380.1 asparagine synthase (glutamine-hydrolyzing) [Pseudoxanthomonas japonensis]
MCGIAGFSGADVTPDGARPALERMIHPLAHRGPDGFGFHAEPGAALAHARLSIIDLATGDQPIHNERRTAWTVFNGEIFNYVELRRDLEARGHRFYTHSDTEVIVHLYDRYGDDFVQHLNGQFAIALWDGERRRLVLARDRAGIRPLYHAHRHGRVWFASEVKSLLAVLPECAQLNPRALMQTLTYWAPVDPDTLYEGVQSLPPGCLLSIEADGSQHLRPYWNWTFPDAAETAPSRYPLSVEQATAELRTLLVDAVRLQLRADVPVGAYLSGGLDSSGIVALIKGFTDTPVRTFSVAFEDGEFDESEHQQAMVRHLGTDHTTLRCTRRDIGEAFPRLIRHTETPVLRTAPVPLMLLAGSVREHGYKVVLTGEGADEVFGGYDLFKEAKVRRFWARQPDSRLRPRLLERLYGYLRNSPVSHPGFAQSFFGQGMEHLHRPVFAHVPRWTTSQRALGFLSPDLRAASTSWDPLDAYEQTLPPEIMAWSPLARDQYVEAKSLLAGYLLSSQGDRVAMANSIEGRFPYLDHRVIEFANRLPPSFKIRGMTEKYLLRRALADLLPADIVQRTKQPYRAPDSQSFFFDGKPLDYVAELLAPASIRDAGYFEPQAVSRLVEKCRQGRATGFADNQAFVGILSTMLVHRQLNETRTAPHAHRATDAPLAVPAG